MSESVSYGKSGLMEFMKCLTFRNKKVDCQSLKTSCWPNVNAGEATLALDSSL